MALVRNGRDPCPAGPLATSCAPLGCFSVVSTKRIVRLPVPAPHAAALRQADLRVDIVPVLVHQVLDAWAGGSFFARFRDEDHVAIERHVASASAAAWSSCAAIRSLLSSSVPRP